MVQVLETPYDVQKGIAPYLEVRALRRVIQTFTNDVHQDFAKWAANPAVLQMLAQAKTLLADGKLTEEDVEHALMLQLDVSAHLHIESQQAARCI